ncbi:Chondroitin sulfate proteoglycan 4 [Lonchura striata]|uniref:Chondroitin sulfate proteoglycan 4 n=1 Tax=Lonchura striata TaxID=40157 RepID=A0A218UYW4_9PASE|nr:Chondroitin sulfate proteoglycan 4 [Lonchura striata domestica]
MLDILMPLKPSPGFKNIREVSVGCSDEFFADEEEPISFFSSKSYISFSSWNVDDEGIFTSVNDSHWHYIRLKFTAEYLQLTVDEETVKKSLPPQSKLPLLKGSFFVGGVDDSIRSEVMKLISVSGKYARGVSFKGCFRNLKANSEEKSLKNILPLIDKWHELISQYHEDYDSFRFLISTNYLDSNFYDFEVYIKSDFRNVILTNNGLNVIEGERKLIISMKIFVQTPDNKTFQYEMIEFPKHGKLKLTNFSVSFENNDNLKTFTNKDITGKCLMYVHDDSETMFDEFLVRASSKESGKGTNFDSEVEPLSVEIRFCISVQLKNDEKPVQIIDKIFDIVRNGQ